MTLCGLSATDATKEIRDGQTSSSELVEACLRRIQETDDAIGAWAILDRDGALIQAAAMDNLRRSGRPIGPLHGVPVAVSDDFDIEATPAVSDNRPPSDRQGGTDAAVIEKLREAGAVIIGKTAGVTTAPPGRARPRNPHDIGRAAGDAGAAAVAAGHVPLAVGGSAGGSMLHAASYCGVVGLTPSRGIISRRGCRTQSTTLDRIGGFGRTPLDVATLCDALAGFDASDGASYTRPKPRVELGYRAQVPVEPCFAWIDPPFADQLSTVTRDGLSELLEALGEQVERVPAPSSFVDVIDALAVVRGYESPDGRGREDTYQQALGVVDEARRSFDAFFKDFDAIIAPAAFGAAPALDDGPSDVGVCWDLWNVAGLPCIALPWLVEYSGLPAAVQLIGSAEEDDRLLRTVAWLEGYLTTPEADVAGTGDTFDV